RQPIDWTVRALEDSAQTLKNWANILERNQTSFNSDEAVPESFADALADDLNTPMAIAEMHKLADSARRNDLKSGQQLHRAGEFIGVFSHALMSSVDFANIGQSAANLMSEDFRRKVGDLIDTRNAARKAKDFKESDRIRDELKAMGVVLKDSKEGTTWE